MPDEIVDRTAPPYDVDGYPSDELNRLVAVREAVDVVERLEVIQIEVEHGKRVVLFDSSPQLALDCEIAGQPRKR